MSYEQPPDARSPAPTPPSPPTEAVGGNGGAEVHDDDRAFVHALHEAGRLRELDEDGIGALVEQGVEREDGPVRRLDLLRTYYEANGDERTASRRRVMDRFFYHHADHRVTARELLERLENAAPEVGTVRLERIGGDDGPLVLRSGEHFAAVLDPYEESLDTDEIDLRDIDSEEPTVPVSGLVRAVNALLGKNDVPERLVQLRSDGEREAYVGAGAEEAEALLGAGLLEDHDVEELREFAGW